MAGHRRVIASVTIAVGVAALGGVGVTLAANAQGSEVKSAASAPQGSYDFSSHYLWVDQTVTMTQTSISDDDTPAAEMLQIVNWGDGTAQTAPGTTTRFTHVYRTAGTYAVRVTVTDGEGPLLAVPKGRVVVRKDATKPAATLTKPSSPTRAASWATLKGKASDTGTGVRVVAVTAIEKRGKAWYYYNGSAWVKAPSASVAGRKAKVLTAVPAAGTWTLKIKGLTKGSVRFAYSAFDRAGNRSAAKYLTQTLR